MELVVERLAGDPIEEREVEIVERKGLGHPDTWKDIVSGALALDRWPLQT